MPGEDETEYQGMPMVRTSDGFNIPWDRTMITRRLRRETRLAREIFDLPAISKEDAERVAEEIETRIIGIHPRFLSAPMVREMVNNLLLEWSDENPNFAIYRNLFTRVGTPVYDAYQIDIGNGREARENANLQPNPETSHKKKADRMSKDEYLLLFPPNLAHAHHDGDLHVHTLEYFGTRPFCQDWDLRYFLYYGLTPDGRGYQSSVAGPAKKAEVAVLHSVKILAAAQTNFSGGQGFLNYTLFLAPYLRGLPYERVKQLAQMLLFEFTQAYVSRGGQLIFSSIQLPMGVPKIWQDVPIVAKGKVGPDVYGNYEDEVQTFYKAIAEVSLKGDYWGKPFNFPKNEHHISPEFFNGEYDDLWLLTHKAAAKFGAPYFDNMMPGYRGYGEGVSCYQCCAYQFSSTPDTDPLFKEKLMFEDGHHFSMGAWQVISLNMPRLAYQAKGDYDLLLEKSREVMRQAVEIFKIKKKWMTRIRKHDMSPFVTQTPRDLKTGKLGPPAVDDSGLVYVMGLVGMNEMAQAFTGSQLHEGPEALRTSIRLLLDMEKYRKGLEMKTGLTLSLARTPAESTAQTFAVKDLVSPTFRRAARRVVKGAGNGRRRLRRGVRDQPVYYSNGTHTYVGAQIPFGEKLDIEQKFFPLLSGGNIFHAWMGEASSDPEALYKLTQRIVEHTQIGYFAYTMDLSICSACMTTSRGLLDACPNCGGTEVRWWSRITGYYSDVTNWNTAKKRELQDRYKAVF